MKSSFSGKESTFPVVRVNLFSTNLRMKCAFVTCEFVTISTLRKCRKAIIMSYYYI